MNSLQRVLVAMSRKGKPDRVPFEISWGAFTPSLMEVYRQKTGVSVGPDEYFDVGIDILNPVQPECNDFREIARKSAGRLAFWGGISTQSTMPFGSPGEVAAAVARTKQMLGSEGGLLLAPTHILEPEVPWENVVAFVETAKKSFYQ